MMIRYSFLFLLFIIACSDRRNSTTSEQPPDLLRQHALDSTDSALHRWKQQLQVREQELDARERLLDSTTLIQSVYDSTLLGVWRVQMICTQTSCEGWAVGDTKSERWTIGYQHDSVLISAFENGHLKRVYTGRYDGKELHASALQSDSTSTLMRVTLRKTKDNRLEGERELTGNAGCTVLYSLSLAHS